MNTIQFHDKEQKVHDELMILIKQKEDAQQLEEYLHRLKDKGLQYDEDFLPILKNQIQKKETELYELKDEIERKEYIVRWEDNFQKLRDQNNWEGECKKLKERIRIEQDKCFSVIVKTRTGKSVNHKIFSDMTIFDLRLLNEEFDECSLYCNLIFSGKYLENDHTFSDYNIQKDAIINVILPLGGWSRPNVKGKNGILMHL